jgi:hypothetical protein
MAFDEEMLAGGITESYDAGTRAYKQVLAVRNALLVTTNAGQVTTFDAEFRAMWGFDSLAGMQDLPESMRQRAALWARLNLLRRRAIFDSVPLPAADPYFFALYMESFQSIDERLMWAVATATERWYATAVRAVDEGDLDAFLAETGILPYGVEGGLIDGTKKDQWELAIALIRIFDTDYDDITDADEFKIDLDTARTLTRHRSRGYQTHLKLMGWFAEGLQTVLLADQRSAFNAFSQQNWGATAVAPLVAEMVELFRKVQTLGAAAAGFPHDLLLLNAELVAHGYAPEVFFQLIDSLPGDPAPGPGAVWVEFPENVANQKTLECSLMVHVPAGVSITDVNLRLRHEDANALMTRYANADGATPGPDVDQFLVNNLDVNGVGVTELIAHIEAGLDGGSEGEVFELGTFDLHYGTIGELETAIAPRPYQVFPELLYVDAGRVLKTATLTMGSHTIQAGNTVELPIADSPGEYTVLVADTDFSIGANEAETVANLIAAIDALDGYAAEEGATSDELVVTKFFPTGESDIRLTGTEIIADFGGDSFSFSTASGASVAGAFFGRGFRMLAGLKNDGGRNYRF